MFNYIVGIGSIIESFPTQNRGNTIVKYARVTTIIKDHIFQCGSLMEHPNLGNKLYAHAFNCEECDGSTANLKLVIVTLYNIEMSITHNPVFHQHWAIGLLGEV